MPTTVDEALILASQRAGECLYVAGGTDVQVRRKQELLVRPHVIDLSQVPSLRRIQRRNDQFEIGSMVTLEELSEESASCCPMLVEAVRSVASPVIRCTATVGGNLLVSNRCTYYNQSRFWRETAGSCLRDVGPTCLATGVKDKCTARNVSDLAPALIALNSSVEIRDQHSTHVVPLSDLYVADGIRSHAYMEHGAILTAIRVSTKPVRWWYRKLRRRQSIDFTSLTVAGAVDTSGQVRICLNGVSTSPVLMETDLATSTLPDLQRRARRACQTVDNDVMSLKYRRQMMDLFLAHLWHAFTEE
ncbi:MAG TPA: FAD binding domain-containing protein [Candidatus Deferrimicrobium sp.]|nr:FAD binding domain-containing protein [Candidatus Deferrimicrobium sp.]